MEKKRIRNFRATEDRMLEAAINFGARFGLDSLSTLKLSEKLKISEGNIFFHFKTKDALVEASFLKIKRKINDEILAFVNQEDPKYLWTAFNQFIEFSKRKPMYAKFLNNLYSSKYLKEVDKKSSKYDFLFIEKVRSTGKFASEESAYAALLICTHSCLDSVLMLVEGVLKDSEEMRTFLFKHIFSF